MRAKFTLAISLGIILLAYAISYADDRELGIKQKMDMYGLIKVKFEIV